MTGSLEYRKNESRIIRGDVPEKYLRIAPHIPGKRILEIGSAEGVLALLMARDHRKVIALERQTDRHRAALRLSEFWASQFKFERPQFVNGDISDNLALLDGVNTLVAVRVIYYLRDELDTVFAKVKVPNVVLCGNRNRADRYRAGVKDTLGGPHNYYASREGMKDLLTRHGYAISKEVTEGDEIVVGRK